LAARRDPRITSQQAWKVGLSGLSGAERTRNAQVLNETQVRAVVVAAYDLDLDYGLFIEVEATTGARASQLARLEVADLQADRRDARLLMPSSKKGKHRQIVRRPVPIPHALAMKLRHAVKGRAPQEPLLRWRPRSNDWKLFEQAITAAGITGSARVTPYALRHSAITRALIAGVPARLVAALHDTSVAMLERTYSAYIADHADQTARLGLLDLSAPEADKVVTLRQQ
jgi:integrase